MNTYLPESKHHIRESMALVTLRVVFTFIMTGFIYTLFLIIFVSNNPFENLNFTLLTLFSVFFILMLFNALFVLSIILSRLATDYYISEHSLIVHRGIMHVEEDIYELGYIRAVKRVQSWFGRIFHYGDLVVTLATTSYAKHIRLRGIQKPKKYEKILEEFIARQKSVTPPDQKL